GPVLAQTARLIFVIVGGSVLVSQGAGSTQFFWLAASSMMLLGILAAAAVRLTNWGPREATPD
ncbi:MAG: MATE family efflux transporter, partial [Afipia sp.]